MPGYAQALHGRVVLPKPLGRFCHPEVLPPPGIDKSADRLLMFQNVGVYGFTQQQLAVAAWLVAVDIGQAQASSTALMFWCLSSTEDLLRPFSSWRSAGCARTCCTAPQPPRHAACRNSLRPWRDLFFGPVFADANDAKPEPRQRRNDGRLATGEAVSSERALLGKLLAEGHTGDGLGIAIGAGLRITYQKSRDLP